MNCLQVLQLWNFSQLEAESTQSAQRSDHGIFQVDAATCQTLNQSALRKRALVGCLDMPRMPRSDWQLAKNLIEKP